MVKCRSTICSMANSQIDDALIRQAKPILPAVHIVVATLKKVEINDRFEHRSHFDACPMGSDWKDMKKDAQYT